MALTFVDNSAVFADVVRVDDAEALLEWVQLHPIGEADFSGCTHLHAANLQVLMATRMHVAAWPRDEALRAWLTAALAV